ncbi:MAG: hypothetical protein ACLR4X_00055 [Clostridia bacterium]|jgi:hypothetical protein
MKNEKRIMEIDRVAYAIILNSLFKMKNELQEQQKETDLINKVIVNIIKAPSKQKIGIFSNRKKNKDYETTR